MRVKVHFNSFFSKVNLCATLILVSACAQPDAIVVSNQDPFIDAVQRVTAATFPIVCMPDHTIILGTGFFIDEAGNFMTASHVISPSSCKLAVVLPSSNWDNRILDKIPVRALPIKSCMVHPVMDISVCSINIGDAKAFNLPIHATAFETSPPPVGTEIAFTGFPLNTPVPVTARGHIATYQIVPNSERGRVLMIDRTSWPGASGSAVYLSNGKVIGILVALTKEEEIPGASYAMFISERELVWIRKEIETK